MALRDITKDLFLFDRNYAKELVCGVDEAGRGPLCGPVVCAAVVFNGGSSLIDGVNDSKKLAEKMREKLYGLITASAVTYRIEVVGIEEIEELNILGATKKGMERAIEGLALNPDIILVDAVKGLNIRRPYEPLIKGDAKSYAVAAASILAKVTRDRIMAELAVKYPLYGFERNKGYGTSEHIAALKLYGKTDCHREKFIRNFISAKNREA